MITNGIARFKRGMRVFDWGLAVGSLGYGAAVTSPLWIAGGVIGLGIAWYDPGTRLQKYLVFKKPPPVAK